MDAPTKLTTLYIDFDAFFANVEKQLCPEEAHRPTGVSAFPSDHSALIAQCYVAKAYGLHRGIKVQEAKRLCPDIRIVPARHDVYVQMHHKIIAAIEKHIPVKKVWSVDEMECDFGKLSDETCLNIARKIRDQISEDIGEYVTPSIGLSSCNLLAKIAAEMNKPHGFEVLHPRDLPGRLLDVPLRDVPGIAAGIEKRLNDAGIHTMEDFWHSSPKQARAIWRSVEGERVWWMLHGYPVEKAPTKRAMYGHSRQLSGTWTSKKRGEDCLRLLAAQAARRMRKDGFLATKLSVSIKDQRKDRWSAELHTTPIRDDYSILRLTRRAYAACFEQGDIRSVRQVYITLHGLTRDGAFADNFFDPKTDETQRERLSRLSDAIDATNAKYQSDILTVGLQEQPPGDYAGGKIAFGRIPDAMAYAKRVQASAEDRHRRKQKRS
jgi:DNA polymerase-4